MWHEIEYNKKVGLQQNGISVKVTIITYECGSQKILLYLSARSPEACTALGY